jgi:hypothetical protein
MGPVRLYEIFNAMKLHWSPGTYDFVKYKGKVKHLNQITFNASKEKALYIQAAKKYVNEKDFVLTLIPLFLENENFHISGLNSEAYEKGIEWYRKIQNMTIWYQDDCDTIIKFITEQGMSFQQFFYGNGILDFLVYEKINIETFIILNKFIFFLTKNKKDSIMYKSMYEMKILKYSSFISVELGRFEATFKRSIKKHGGTL